MEQRSVLMEQKSVLTRDIQDTHLARALKLADNPMYFVNRGGNIVWCNHAYGNLVGIPPEDLIGSVPNSIAAGKEKTSMLGSMWDTLYSGKTWMGGLTEDSHRKGYIHLDAVITPLASSGNRKPALFFVMVHDVTVRQIEFTRLKHEINHDPLTGLANRGMFTSMVEKAIAHTNRHGGNAAVLFVDLDGFKGVNDKFGHAAGDMTLKAVAKILLNSIRDSDTAARFGGDEFACLLTDIGDIDNAYMVADKIVSSIGRPIILNECIAQIGASIGVAIFPEDGDNIKSLIAAADESMYAAKSAGKNGWRRKSNEMVIRNSMQFKGVAVDA
jgi:diguanylate cyclase (GGDEF)-like protein/PAS domain S-box-containing protein